MEEKLRDASREELLQHVLTQRLLIRRLHRRIVDLEGALSSAHSAVARRMPTATAEAAEVVVAVTSPSPPRDNLPEGIAAIDRLMKAHVAGKSFIPPEVISELQHIHKELTAGDTIEVETACGDKLSAFHTPVQKITRVSTTTATPVINKAVLTPTPQQWQQRHHLGEEPA